MSDPATAATISVIESGYSHYIIIGCAVAGIAWGGINAMFVSIAPMQSQRLRGSLLPSYDRSLTFLSFSGEQRRARR